MEDEKIAKLPRHRGSGVRQLRERKTATGLKKPVPHPLLQGTQEQAVLGGELRQAAEVEAADDLEGLAGQEQEESAIPL